MPSATQIYYLFGHYRIDVAGGALYQRSKLVRLSPKVLETLIALVECQGQIVTKGELMTRIWPETFVEEINLARNISLLRKILGDGAQGVQFIETIPKRGYRFIAEVKELLLGSTESFIEEKVSETIIIEEEISNSIGQNQQPKAEEQPYRLHDFAASMQAVKTAFEENMKHLQQNGVRAGEYKRLLRELFYYLREEPQIQILAASHFRGWQRKMMNNFYQHAFSKTGLAQLVLNDLRALNEDVAILPFARPLPATSAVLAFGFYQVTYLNPTGYLGYAMFLEIVLATLSEDLIRIVAKARLPQTALSFLQERVRLRARSIQMIEGYLEGLVKSKADFETVVYAMRVTGTLFGDLLQAAFKQAQSPQDWGTDYQEILTGI